MAYLLTTLSLVLSILLSALIIPRILVVAYRKKLFDIPNERKVHDGIIPRLGGISFVPTILFSLSFVTGLRYLDRLRNSRKQAPFYHSRIFLLDLWSHVIVFIRYKRRSGRTTLSDKILYTNPSRLHVPSGGIMDQ